MTKKNVLTMENIIIGALILAVLFILYNMFSPNPIPPAQNSSLPQGLNCPAWNGQCTDQIKDICCENVRLCTGQIVENPLECFTYYCWADDECCYPTPNGDDPIAMTFTCNCKDITDAPN